MEYKYEYLIRCIFGCERTCVHGADADIYRAMQLKISPASGKIDLFDAGVDVGMVITYIIEALREIKNRNKEDTSFVALMDDYICLLLYTPSVDNINKCLNEVTEIFVDKGWLVRN